VTTAESELLAKLAMLSLGFPDIKSGPTISFDIVSRGRFAAARRGGVLFFLFILIILVFGELILNKILII
jgi:hypothetical protein